MAEGGGKAMTSNDSRRLDSTLSMSRAGRRWGTAATVMLCFWSGGARSGPVFAAACAFATPFAPPVHLSSAASSPFPLRFLARRREHCLGNARHARLANRQRWHVAMGASCGGDDTSPSAGRAPMPKQIAGGKRDRLRQNIEYILLGRPGGLRQALRQKIVEHRSLHLYVRAEQGSRGQDPTQTPVEPGEETGSAAVLGTGACSSSEITPGQALVGLLENMTGVDLDGDGHVGRPPERRNARPATLASAASSRVGSLRELEARAGKFSERSRVVQAPLEACFAAAADVDRYQEWCHHGLKKLLVLERDDGTLLAKTIKMDVGKFGIRAVSTLEMDYPAPHGSQIRFTCTKGEAIPRIDATYSFVPEPGSPTATRITYQLGLCFAFAIPDLICDNFVDTIVTTALEMLETRILCLEGHHPPPPPPGKRGTGFVWRVEPFDAKAFKVRLRECARLEQLGANGMIEDVASHALAKSVEVPASLDKCFQLAADLDGYMAWCQGSGMQSLEVLERKFGLETANTLVYSYTTGGDQVLFKSTQGDVMPKLDGRYVFRALDAGRDGQSPRTLVTYELDIGFAMGIPEYTHRALVNVILGTALGSFKRQVMKAQGASQRDEARGREGAASSAADVYNAS